MYVWIIFPFAKCQDPAASSVRFLQHGDLPGSRFGHTLVNLDEDILLTCGGLRVDNCRDLGVKVQMSDIFILHVSTMTWERLRSNAPIDLVDFSAGVINGAVVLVGGFTFVNNKPSNDHQ